MPLPWHWSGGRSTAFQIIRRHGSPPPPAGRVSTLRAATKRFSVRRELKIAIEPAKETFEPGEEGEVKVTTQREGEWLELRISDDGCGILPSDSENIFKPLFSTKAFGVGLGLPLAKRIVEGHKGEISVESEWGVGTTISIRLPLIPTPPNAKTEVTRLASKL